LNKKCVAFYLLLVISLVAGLSSAQGQENNTSSIMETNATAVIPEMPPTSSGNNSADANATAANVSASEHQNNGSETAKAASEIAKMEGIWSISGIENEQIIMALKQDGQDLYGAAKYEPEGAQPWNAVAIGSISENNVSLAITALKGNDQVSTWLSGNVNETFDGQYFEVSEGNISLRGEFRATLVNPEITEYAPAKVSAPTLSTPAVQQESQTAVSSATPSAAVANQTSTSQSVTVSGRKKPVDVHEYAEKIGPGGDLSGVPPGMGGAGLA
jgi:hypothetical protein